VESLERLDDGIRPVPLDRPLRIYFLPSKLQTRLALWFALVFIAEIVLYFQLMGEGLTLAAWARFLLPQALVLPFAVKALRRLLRREMGRLELTNEGVRLVDPNVGPLDVAYGEISEYRLGMDATYWFRIRTWDGRDLGVPRRAHLLTPEPEAKLDRTMGPRLPSAAALSRGVPPSDPIERHAWNHFGDPPPTSMERGKRYHYLSPTYLYGAKGDFTMFAATLPPLVPGLVFLKRFPIDGLVVAIYFTYALIALYTAHSLWRMYVLHRAGDDRFEMTDEGIRVSRGKRAWILGDSQLAKGFGGAYRFGRPLYRYGRGLRTYFFDPRFLEEDL
jgi:hypothetical protein